MGEEKRQHDFVRRFRRLGERGGVVVERGRQGQQVGGEGRTVVFGGQWLEAGRRVEGLRRFEPSQVPQHLPGRTDLVEPFILLQRVVQRELGQRRIERLGEFDVRQQFGRRQRGAAA